MFPLLQISVRQMRCKNSQRAPPHSGLFSFPHSKKHYTLLLYVNSLQRINFSFFFFFLFDAVSWGRRLSLKGGGGGGLMVIKKNQASLELLSKYIAVQLTFFFHFGGLTCPCTQMSLCKCSYFLYNILHNQQQPLQDVIHIRVHVPDPESMDRWNHLLVPWSTSPDNYIKIPS